MPTAVGDVVDLPIRIRLGRCQKRHDDERAGESDAEPAEDAYADKDPDPDHSGEST